MAKGELSSAVDEFVEEIELEFDDEAAPEISGLAEEPVRKRPDRNWFIRFLKSKWSKALLAVLLLAVIFAIPMTRYALIGVFVKKPTTITVVDDTTGKPVTDAVVRFARVDARTDQNGVAVINDMSVGDHPLSVEKKHYTTLDTSYLVPILNEASTTVRLKATGRLAAITVKNSITGEALAGAKLTISDTTALTDSAGTATVALAIRDIEQPGTVSAEGYNAAEVAVNTKDISPALEVNLVPSGRVYFLANRSGEFNVMNATLDGKNQTVVVKATGKETASELSLNPSPNRAYLAYLASRGGTTPALYLITTATSEIITVDDSGTVVPIGWVGNTLYYTLYARNADNTVNQRVKLMAHNAANRQKTMVDASGVEADQGVTLQRDLSVRFQLVGERIYYAKCWTYPESYVGDARKAALMGVVAGQAVTLKEVPQAASGYCDAVATKPNIAYFTLTYDYGMRPAEVFRYQLGKTVEAVQLDPAELYDSTVTYLASPNGEKTFWTEVRGGKLVSFISNANGEDAKQVSAAEYRGYGWFGEEYVLYGKGSELFIAKAGEVLDGAHKVTDYFSNTR